MRALLNFTELAIYSTFAGLCAGFAYVAFTIVAKIVS